MECNLELPNTCNKILPQDSVVAVDQSSSAVCALRLTSVTKCGYRFTLAPLRNDNGTECIEPKVTANINDHGTECIVPKVTAKIADRVKVDLNATAVINQQPRSKAAIRNRSVGTFASPTTSPSF